MKTILGIFLCLVSLCIFSCTASAVGVSVIDCSIMEHVNKSVVVIHNFVNEHQAYLGASFALFPIISTNITEDIIKDAKLRCGKIKLLTITVEPAQYDNDGNITTEAEQYQFLVRRPDRSTIKMLLPLANLNDIESFSEKAIKNLIIGGDLEALNDGLVYLACVQQLKALITPAEAFLQGA